jgi:hypothetical protein
MKIEQAKEIAEKAIGQLAESLERGQSEGLKDYLAAMARFPRAIRYTTFCSSWPSGQPRLALRVTTLGTVLVGRSIVERKAFSSSHRSCAARKSSHLN